MKSIKFYKNAALFGLTALTLAFGSCSDDKTLMTGEKPAKLLEEINFEVSDILPLGVGMDSTLVYTYGPLDADEPTVVFSSSNESVATVDQNGKIHAVAVGEAVIMAHSTMGFKVNNAEAAVTVRVIPEVIKATKINLVNSTAVGEEGKYFVTDEIQLVAEILPENHTYDHLIWSSSNDKVATVSQSGLVNCVGVGDVTIKALATDKSNVVGSIDIRVDEYIGAEDVAIAAVAEPVCLSMGDFSLDVAYTPANATMGSVEWTTDNAAVATVRRGIVTPVGFGTCNITATCVASGRSSSVTITVDPGWYIWDASNQWGRWIPANNGAASEKGDRFWRLYFPETKEGGKWRRDFKVDCSNSNPLILSKNNYPVLAVRMTKMNGGNSTLDAVENDLGGAGNPNPKNGIDLGDGTQLLVYNLSSKYGTTDILKFRVFQIKLADVPYANVDPAKAYYDIYWIRTFKSEDDARAFADSQVESEKQ